MLKLDNVEVLYSSSILVLRSVSLEVPDGSIIALLGANGAGKSTALKAISGLLRFELGKVSKGRIFFGSQQIDGLNPAEIVKLGITQVLEGRLLFTNLTTEENLRLGGHTLKKRTIKVRNIERVYSYFPRLKILRSITSGYLSGGEQQMLIIARALMANPKLMLLDEPSLGLAPILVKEIFGIIQQINSDEHMSILLVEQNVKAALYVAQRGYVMENGKIVLEGRAEALRQNDDIKEFYLGLSTKGKSKSYREVKYYRKRKRWLE